MKYKKNWKILFFILGIIIGITLLLIGAIKIEDMAQIRLEGSEL